MLATRPEMQVAADWMLVPAARLDGRYRNPLLEFMTLPSGLMCNVCDVCLFGPSGLMCNMCDVCYGLCVTCVTCVRAYV